MKALTRRNVTLATIAAPVAALPALAVGAEPDAELIALGEEIQRLNPLINEIWGREDEAETAKASNLAEIVAERNVLWDARVATFKRIREIQPTTIKGFAAHALAAEYDSDICQSYYAVNNEEAVSFIEMVIHAAGWKTAYIDQCREAREKISSATLIPRLEAFGYHFVLSVDRETNEGQLLVRPSHTEETTESAELWREWQCHHQSEGHRFETRDWLRKTGRWQWEGRAS